MTVRTTTLDGTNCGNSLKISSFTAFISASTDISIQLKCKSSSPTSNYPSLLGFYMGVE